MHGGHNAEQLHQRNDHGDDKVEDIRIYHVEN
jgi:hypothetical protein